MIVVRRNYNEFNLDNVLSMTQEEFDKMLTPEIYSLVLMFRLLELIDNLEYLEEYRHCAVIQMWFDENSITFRLPEDEE
jgi:hypothetical protein